MTIDKSNLDITQVNKPVIAAGSLEDFYMSADSAIRVIRGYEAAGLQVGEDIGGPGNPGANDRPQLSDIMSVTKTTYYDQQQKKTFAKVVIRMRNSSGKNILGIDARTTVPQSLGGK